MTTLTSVKSGRWSDPTVWDLNRLPAAGDRVVIASGHTVTYDIAEGSTNDIILGSSSAPSANDIEIRGTLQFDTSATQPLRLRFNGRIYLRSTGRLYVGTPSNPMPVRVTIMKTTAGHHMILHDNNAEVSLVGSPNVPYDSSQGWYRFVTTLASAASSGATQITVSENLNWQVGDWVMLPRLPATEMQTSIILPHLAQVTAVSGNTLTLSSALPHDYPAGAWVAKVNRPITIFFTNNSTSNHVFNPAASGNFLNVTGLRWSWFQVSGTSPNYFVTNGNFYDNNISYNTLLSSYHNVNTTLVGNFAEPTTIYYHCGAPMQGLNHPTRHVGGVLSSHLHFFGTRRNMLIENAHVWCWYPLGNMSNKVSMKDCTIFHFCPRQSVYHFVEDSVVYGLHYFSNFTTFVLSRNIFRNCKFYNYSTLGYSTTMRNRFDWGEVGGLMFADYLDCELYGTWVEPYTFADIFGYDTPKVRFVNKKVGDTVIKEQEFQVGGVITSDEATLPHEGNIAYSLKFEPKNPALPLVYDIHINPGHQVAVYFYRQSSITDLAKVQLVSLEDQFVANPTTTTPIVEVNLLNYPSNQWNKVVLSNNQNSNVLLRVMCRGTTGAMWVAFADASEPSFVFVG